MEGKEEKDVKEGRKRIAKEVIQMKEGREVKEVKTGR